MKTKSGKKVQEGRIYELKYKWGEGYAYGYGIYHPKQHSQVDIICHDGGVTYAEPEDVIFLKQYK
jgi:hypothetical protein